MALGSHSGEKKLLFHYVLQEKEKTEWNRPAGCSVMCGFEGEGIFVPSDIKIASLPTMTYSHEFSTSPTTLSSPPSYTQQLFKWSTIGYIQCRYECLKTRIKKKKLLQRTWDDIPRCNFKRHCTFLTLRFRGVAKPGSSRM